MPYFIHPKGAVLTDENTRRYVTEFVSRPTREEAHALADMATEKITFWPNSSELFQWRDREAARFGRGLYLAVPWAAYPKPDIALEHYCHMAIKGDIGLIAYTKSVEAGCQDRQTRVRPGKYLQEYYSHVDKAQRDKWIAECQATDTPLQLVTSPDDIEKVYANGPESCMAGPMHGDKSRYWGWDKRVAPPVRAYGDSDFGVVYTGSLDKPSGRAVVRLAAKTYTRIYGDVDRLALLLEREGYTLGSIHGARLRAIRDGDGYLAPYVDGVSTESASGHPHRDGQTRENVSGKLSPCGQFIELGGYGFGRLSVTETYGHTAHSDPEADVTDDDTHDCHHCGDTCPSDEDYCSSCRDAHWTCDACGDEGFNRDESYGLEYATLCESCYDDQHHNCDAPSGDCSNDFNERDFSSRERREREARHVEGLCAECAADWQWCADCRELWDTTDTAECPNCAPATPDAPVAIVATKDTDTLPLPLTPEYCVQWYTDTPGCRFDSRQYWLIIGPTIYIWNREPADWSDPYIQSAAQWNLSDATQFMKIAEPTTAYAEMESPF